MKSPCLVAVLLSFLLAFVTEAAEATPLPFLADRGLTITQGDKEFSDFSIQSFSSNEGTIDRPLLPSLSSNASPDSPQEIEVSGVTIAGEHGLMFSVIRSSFIADAACGGIFGPFECIGASLLVSFSYTVTVLGSDLIDGITLIPVGPASQDEPSSGFVAAGGASVNAPFTTSDSEDFSAPVSTRTISTRVSLSAGGQCEPGPIVLCDSGRIQLGSFAEVFSQVTPQVIGVPEPASLALIGIALAGLGFSRRRGSSASHCG